MALLLSRNGRRFPNFNENAIWITTHCLMQSQRYIIPASLIKVIFNQRHSILNVEI